jgi:hypothetical protein
MCGDLRIEWMPRYVATALTLRLPTSTQSFTELFSFTLSNSSSFPLRTAVFTTDGRLSRRRRLIIETVLFAWPSWFL